MAAGMDIGSIIASISADIKQLEKKMGQANTLFKDYAKTVDREVDKADREIKKHANNVNRNLNNIDNQLKKSGTAFNGFIKTVRAATIGYFTVLGTMELVNFSTGIIQAGKELDSLNRTFKAITGSTRLAAIEIEFISNVADKYGLELTSLEKSYKGLLASTKETNLEGKQTRRLFEVMSGTAAVLGMSVDDTRGSLRAFVQMISKGNVQAEELRGQLGERLYGAFRLAAKGMGVSTMGLNKMLERGEVLADDLIPKIVDVMENEYGDAMEEAGDRAEASFINLTNSVTRLQRAIAEAGVLDFFANMADNIASATNRINDLIASEQKYALMQERIEIENQVQVIQKIREDALKTRVEKEKEALEQIKRNEEAYRKELAFKRSFMQKVQWPQRTKLLTADEYREDKLNKLQTRLSEINSLLYKTSEEYANVISEAYKMTDSWMPTKQLIEGTKKLTKEAKEYAKLIDELFKPIGKDSWAKQEVDFWREVNKEAEAYAKLIDELAKPIGTDDNWAEKEAEFWREVEQAQDKAIQKAKEKAEEYSELIDDLFQPIERDSWAEQEAKYWEEASAQAEEYQELLDKLFEPIGTDDHWAEKEAAYWEEVEKEMDDSKTQIEKYLESIEQASRRVFGNLEDELVDFITGTKFSFEDLVDSIIEDLARIAVQEQVTKPLSSWFGSLFAATGYAFGSEGVKAFAKGSPFTNTIVSEPTMFAYGGGFGVMGEAGDEAILPLTRTSSGNLGVEAVNNGVPRRTDDIELHFHNAPRVTETKKTQNEKGGMRLEVFFEENVAKVLSGQNKATRVLENNYNLSRSLGGR